MEELRTGRIHERPYQLVHTLVTASQPASYLGGVITYQRFEELLH